MTPDQLGRFLFNTEKAKEWHGPLYDAMVRREIRSALQQAHFLAQVAHESGGFRYTAEIWGPTEQQKRYEPPSTLADTLGNTEEGDGYRYRGRGLIQLTGKANYRQYSEEIGVDFLANPDLLQAPDYAADVAAWYWQNRGLNRLADADDVEAVTLAINGGLNGFADRKKWLERAKAILSPYPSVIGDFGPLVLHNFRATDFFRAGFALLFNQQARELGVTFDGAFRASRTDRDGGEKLDVRLTE